MVSNAAGACLTVTEWAAAGLHGAAYEGLLTQECVIGMILLQLLPLVPSVLPQCTAAVQDDQNAPALVHMFLLRTSDSLQLLFERLGTKSVVNAIRTNIQRHRCVVQHICKLQFYFQAQQPGRKILFNIVIHGPGLVDGWALDD